MSSPARFAKRRAVTFTVSIAVHAALLAFLVSPRSPLRMRPVIDIPPLQIARIEVAGGSHAVPIHLPVMATAARTRHPEPHAEAQPKTILPVKPTIQRPGGGSPAAPHAGQGSGNALAGNGSDDQNARPAFPVFFPRPPITDRALLPASVQKVVVEVKIDVTGAVISEDLVSGVSSTLDQLVLQTVKTWRFQPATVDGKPIPAQAELIFPFDQNYPITNS